MPRNRRLHVLLFCGISTLLWGEASAQTAWLVPNSSFATFSTQLDCGWGLYWTPEDAFGDLRSEVTLGAAGKTSYYSLGNGLAGYAGITTSLRGEYLPSTTYRCSAQAMVLWPGYQLGLSDQVDKDWDNPSCNGWPPYILPPHEQSFYELDWTFESTYPDIAQAVHGGAGYWGSVGSELQYSSLYTRWGGNDLVVEEGFGMPPNEPGNYISAYRSILLNASGPAWSFDQWALIAAHEFGHAAGFYHASAGGTDESIMQLAAAGATGLHTRKLDKCAAVRYLQVDLQIQ